MLLTCCISNEKELFPSLTLYIELWGKKILFLMSELGVFVPWVKGLEGVFCLMLQRQDNGISSISFIILSFLHFRVLRSDEFLLCAWKKRMNALRSSEFCSLFLRNLEGSCCNGWNGKYGCDVLCSYKFAVGDTLKFCLLVSVINFNVKILYYNSL